MVAFVPNFTHTSLQALIPLVSSPHHSTPCSSSRLPSRFTTSFLPPHLQSLSLSTSTNTNTNTTTKTTTTHITTPTVPRATLQQALDASNGLQKTILDRINAVTPLTPKSDHAEGILGTTQVAYGNGAATASVGGFAALPKVGWVSASMITENKTESLFAEIVAQVSPNIDVPHLRIAFTYNPRDRWTVDFDLIAREDLVYARDYLAAYYQPTYQAIVQPFYANHSDQVKQLPPQGDLMTKALVSPVAIQAAVHRFEIVQNTALQFVDLWLKWMTQPTEVNRMKRGSMYARDSVMHKGRFRGKWTALNQFMANAQIQANSGQMQQLAAAIVGPGDEPYTGGGGGESSGV